MFRRAALKSVSLGARSPFPTTKTATTRKRTLFYPTSLRAKPAVATAADVTSNGKNHIVPDYMKEVYWWAYLHPNAIRVFERKWLVDAILWGNFNSLRDSALQELAGNKSNKGIYKGDVISGKTLQIACVYGDFTERLIKRMSDDDSSLDVVDVAPIQIQNLRNKLSQVLPSTAEKKQRQIQMTQQNAAYLDFESDSYDQVILFFLLHEMPEEVRKSTLHNAVRVLQPGGKLVIVDYHQPTSRLHPHRYIMPLVLKTLEPFAMDLWRQDVQTWLPVEEEDGHNLTIRKELYFGGLYQKVVVTKEESSANVS